MPSTTTQTTIANRALQLLGYKSINLITDNDRGARAVQRAYQPVLYAMLREHYWGFAIKRANLAASATPPVFGNKSSYPLPGDFLDLAPQDPNYGVNYGGTFTGAQPSNDWQIEGQAIVSADPSPLQVRYVSSSVTEAQFDASFCEALSARIAMNICEELTQSNTKKADAKAAYEDAMEQAAKRNAFEARPVKSPVSSWLSSRV